jgi:hypothetical protein
MNQFPDHYEVQAMHEKGKKKGICLPREIAAESLPGIAD